MQLANATVLINAATVGFLAEDSEVLADEATRQVHAGLSAQPAVYLQAIAL